MMNYSQQEENQRLLRLENKSQQVVHKGKKCLTCLSYCNYQYT